MRQPRQPGPASAACRREARVSEHSVQLTVHFAHSVIQSGTTTGDGTGGGATVGSTAAAALRAASRPSSAAAVGGSSSTSWRLGAYLSSAFCSSIDDHETPILGDAGESSAARASPPSESFVQALRDGLLLSRMYPEACFAAQLASLRHRRLQSSVRERQRYPTSISSPRIWSTILSTVSRSSSDSCSLVMARTPSAKTLTDTAALPSASHFRKRSKALRL